MGKRDTEKQYGRGGVAGGESQFVPISQQAPAFYGSWTNR